MRTWKIRPGQPLCLNLAADSRMSKIDLCNDQIWEMKLGGSEPAAMTLQTTYGLRAKSMRVFPRFIRNDITLSDPLQFHQPPELEAFYPNYLRFHFSPFSGLDICAEYWAPESFAVCGRIKIRNNNEIRDTTEMEWICQLSPMGEGQNMSAIQVAMSNVLQGATKNLVPVFFLTGGPGPAKGAFPGLTIQLDLQPHGERTLAWALASMSDVDSSLDLARRLTARSWDAEVARIEIQNASDAMEITTGDIEWDIAFAFSQRMANALAYPSNERIPNPTFLLSRLPDHGFSSRQDGSDHTHLWGGQTVLDTYLFANALPGQRDRLRDVLRNFLASADPEGNVEFRPSLFLNPTRLMAQPLLCELAWQLAGIPADKKWLEEVYPALILFYQAWFSTNNDRDRDGFPEWAHPMQTGLENAPIYDRWHGGQGMDTAFIEAPGLAALLINEAQQLIRIANVLGNPKDVPFLQERSEALRLAIQSTWDNTHQIYRYRDTYTHLSPAGERIISFNGSAKTKIDLKTQQPLRLIAFLNIPPESTHNIQLKIYGQTRKGFTTEIISSRQWSWSEKQAVATSANAFIAIRQIEVIGLPPEGIGWLSTCSYTQEDCSLLLPLWAKIPSNEQAKQIIRHTLLNRFAGDFGIATSPSGDTSSANLVSLGFNLLLAEGMLRYGMRRQAAELFTRWMNAILPSLRQSQTFRANFNAINGQGSGESNALRGLIPIGFFLKLCGIQNLERNQVLLEGNNPFPWPITVQYQGMNISCQTDHTKVTFPNGQSIEVGDDQPHLITL